MFGWLRRLFISKRSSPVEEEQSGEFSFLLDDPNSLKPSSPAVFRRVYDEYESYPDDDEERWPVKVSAWIAYKDRREQESEREIETIFIVKRQNDCLIHAFCKDKQAQRSFLSSRITKYIDVETGEFINEPGLYLIEKFWETPIGRLRKIADALADELKIIAFVIRADGQLRQKQREIVLSFVSERFPYLLALEKDMTSLVSDGVTQQEYRRCLKRIKDKPAAERAALLSVLEGISKTRKTQREFTDSAMIIARKQLA